MINLLLLILFFNTSDCFPLPATESIHDGVKIVSTKSGSYLVAVGSTSNSVTNFNTKSRISTIRARRNVSDYMNGTTITSESILETGEIVRNESVEFHESFKERITEQGSGFVDGMEVSCTWVSADGKNFFTAIFRKLN